MKNKRAPEPIPCSLGVFRLTESDWVSLATSYPSYVGQSVNISSRWRTYLESATDFRKHKNALDRVGLKRNRVLFRLLDWAIADADSLNNCERCQIAIWKPSLNRVTFGYDESYCQLPIKRSRLFKRQSGIYQLIVVPLSVVRDIPMTEVAVKDVVYQLDIDIRANPERLKGYVPLKKLKFYDFS